MTRTLAALVLVWGVFCATLVSAQDRVWIQIEARPNLGSATERAQAYSDRFADVSGFAIGGGWFGIVLGPYREADAPRILAELKRARSIPADSFVADGGGFREQFFPAGAQGTQSIADDPTPPTETIAVEPIPEPVIQIPDETTREARASEAQLTRPEREELQIALQWAGFYQSAIDGAYGRGTRSAMGAWQVANNHEETGILTTGQRAELLTAYNSVLDGMNLTRINDAIAGVSLVIPAGVVEFNRYDPPFGRFTATGDIDAQVLIISQEGSQSTLFGLYDILQTLEIVPPTGPRVRNQSSFEIDGADNNVHTYVRAELRGSEIKGFALIWPADDEERRTRILREMQASFEITEGVLDPSLAEPGEDQAIDLVSGLSIRKPVLSRSGFYLNDAGDVVTVAEAVNTCGRITIDRDIEAQVIQTYGAQGAEIAILRATTPLAPPRFAAFQTRTPRLNSEISVSGFPFEGVLSAPTVTFGTLADLRGLGGEDQIMRLNLQAEAGDAGGPVFDATGHVLGILLPRNTEGRQLPADVAFLGDIDLVRGATSGAEPIAMLDSEGVGAITPQELTRRAAEMTVLVSCWEE